MSIGLFPSVKRDRQSAWVKASEDAPHRTTHRHIQWHWAPRISAGDPFACGLRFDALIGFPAEDGPVDGLPVCEACLAASVPR